MTRKVGHGIPGSIKQVGVENRKELMKIRDNLKAALLEECVVCPNLVASSICDTNPVHYVSMVTK